MLSTGTPRLFTAGTLLGSSQSEEVVLLTDVLPEGTRAGARDGCVAGRGVGASSGSDEENVMLSTGTPRLFTAGTLRGGGASSGSDEENVMLSTGTPRLFSARPQLG
jgi:hypothetical protein